MTRQQDRMYPYMGIWPGTSLDFTRFTSLARTCKCYSYLVHVLSIGMSNYADIFEKSTAIFALKMSISSWVKLNVAP